MGSTMVLPSIGTLQAGHSTPFLVQGLIPDSEG